MRYAISELDILVKDPVEVAWWLHLVDCSRIPRDLIRFAWARPGVAAAMREIIDIDMDGSFPVLKREKDIWIEEAAKVGLTLAVVPGSQNICPDLRVANLPRGSRASIVSLEVLYDDPE